MNRRSAVFWVGLAVLLLAIGLVAPRQAQGGAPLDPDATTPDGTAALMEVLGRFGLDVRRELPPPEGSRALLLSEELTPEQRDRLETWVEAGGTLVVTDPNSSFAPFRYEAGFRDDPGSVTAAGCAVPRLDGLRVEAERFLFYRAATGAGSGGAGGDPGGDPGGGGPGGGGSGPSDEPGASVPAFRPDTACFGNERGDWLQVDRRGAGQVIALGGGAALTNRNLGRADNAVLAVSLLSDAGRPGPQPVSVIYGPVLEPGTRTLRDLIPRGAKWAAWELLIAFAVYVLWRARRLGRPVTEPQPVELPGSLLVRATGELQRRSRAEAEASTVLRADLEQRLRRRLKVAPETDRAELTALAAAAAPGLDPTAVARALAGAPATTPQELVALVTDIDRVNATLLAAEAPTPVAPIPSDPVGRLSDADPVPVPVGAADRGAPS